MLKKKFLLSAAAVFFIAVFSNTAIKAQTSSIFVTGMKAPTKIIYAARQGYFLVAEAGIPVVPNSGRVFDFNERWTAFYID